MSTDKPMPRWGQWATGGVLLAVALTAGGLGLALNVSHGLQVSPAAGLTFGLADIGKIVIPIAAAAIGWSRQMRVTVAICAAVSIWCAVNFYIDRHGRDLSSRQGQATTWSGAQEDAARLRAELARITETGDAATLRAQANAASQTVATELKSGKGPRYDAAVAEQSKLSGRAGQAERRAELERKLEQAKSEASAAGGPVQAGSAGQGMIEGAMFLVLIEALVWLNMPATQLLAAAWSARPKRRKRVAKTAAVKPKSKAPAKPRKAPARRKTPPATVPSHQLH